MRRRDIAARLQTRDRSRGIRHSHGPKDSIAHEVVPALARDGLNDLTRNAVENVVVGELAAEAGNRLQEPNTIDDFVTRVVRLGEIEQVASAESHSAPMRAEIP